MPNQCETCDGNVFAKFFKSHERSLRNFLYYKFGNEEQANDIAQEAFIKLWQNCDDIPLEKAKSYLFTVAFKKSLKAIAHQKVVLNFAKSKVIPISTNESPEFVLEEQEFQTKLSGAIANLKETQRVAFLMHRIDKMKYTEIAEHLGISVKAVEKRIHQAMISLKRNIEQFR
ncbi:MAG: sigma-70 family RNA polymerase sigma factor [Flavobacterium sp.]|uniref:RNA polymerase sigma factor n=1 Tax=Flavobacterium sp. TaxID=239 RepID=UPI00122108A9|nr:sigma-70 family RNA polymerase sigma factor [Flavobacterium sp.]RZJ67175.1 MAG: sigma-70 family RNA polymerase sigma factor [Flavobacterium sp.]